MGSKGFKRDQIMQTLQISSKVNLQHKANTAFMILLRSSAKFRETEKGFLFDSVA